MYVGKAMINTVQYSLVSYASPITFILMIFRLLSESKLFIGLGFPYDGELGEQQIQ